MRIRNILAASFAISTLAVGCFVEEQPESESDLASSERARKKLGKADLTGSCSTATCGGKSSGNCWCDEACSNWGDCCSDYEEVCNAPAECQTDSDCYLHSNYCNTCLCEAFPNDLHIAQCPPENVIACFVDPCMNQTAVCQAGECVPSAAPPPPAAPSCEGHCGGSADDGACYCDDLCAGYGDCCGDYADHCE